MILALVTACALCALAIAATPRVAFAAEEPKFGEPGWVAPGAGDIEGEPTDAGPRVAENDHEPTGETILRAPFRVVFFPVKMLARGTESLASAIGPSLVSPPTLQPHYQPTNTIGPAFLFSGWAGLQGGLKWTHRYDPRGRTMLSLQGTYSTKDHRNLRLRQAFGRPSDPRAFTLEGRYGYQPTYRYYGIGNDNTSASRAIYLDEYGRGDAALRFGPRQRHSIQLLATILERSGRAGYNDSPGVQDVFSPEETEALFGSSRVAGLGVGADLGTIDNVRNPTRGIGARAIVRQMRSIDGGGLDYREWHLEARAYVPVFASRRVLAFRAVHENVDPMDDSTPIPPRLYPDTDGDLRFAAYRSHQFRDRHLLIGQAEYRWIVWRKLWALGLAQLGEVANDSRNIRIADVHESYGGGLRYAFNDESIARFEVSKGTEGIFVNFSFRNSF
jgi:hypothetical protein